MTESRVFDGRATLSLIHHLLLDLGVPLQPKSATPMMAAEVGKVHGFAHHNMHHLQRVHVGGS